MRPKLSCRSKKSSCRLSNTDGAKTVYGEPTSAQGKTIVFAEKIRYGFGGGSGRNDKEKTWRRWDGLASGGGGLVANPVEVVEVTETYTPFIPITSNWPLVGTVALGVGMGPFDIPKNQ